MGYKPKYLFVYSKDAELESLLKQFPFNYPYLPESNKKICIKYEHYDLYLLKLKYENDCLEYRESKGMMFTKILMSQSVYNDLKDLDTVQDVFIPMLSKCALIGNRLPEVVEEVC